MLWSNLSTKSPATPHSKLQLEYLFKENREEKIWGGILKTSVVKSKRQYTKKKKPTRNQHIELIANMNSIANSGIEFGTLACYTEYLVVFAASIQNY